MRPLQSGFRSHHRKSTVETFEFKSQFSYWISLLSFFDSWFPISYLFYLFFVELLRSKEVKSPIKGNVFEIEKKTPRDSTGNNQNTQTFKMFLHEYDIFIFYSEGLTNNKFSIFYTRHSFSSKRSETDSSLEISLLFNLTCSWDFNFNSFVI